MYQVSQLCFSQKILSWNVNGLRSVLKKNFIESLKTINPDIVCLQETRVCQEDLPDKWMEDLEFFPFFCSAQKKGYSGVAVLSKIKPQKVETMGDIQFDSEGRFQALDFGKYVLINAYFPNSRAERSRLDYKLNFCQKLNDIANRYRKKNRLVLICGDYNIAHQSIDLERPDANENSPGYYIEERSWMTDFLNDGYIDVFREQHPDKRGHYTWWSYRSGARSRNVGWRIDYQCVSRDFMKYVSSSSICSNIQGSDHCPTMLTLQFESEEKRKNL